MGIVRNLNKPRVDEKYMEETVEFYEGLVDEAYGNFITGLVEAGMKRGVSRSELLRAITNVLTESGWSNHDIGVVLQSVKEKLDTVHYC